MNWTHIAQLFAAVLIIVCIAIVVAGARIEQKNSRRIKYKDLNEHRITPNFRVGSDVRER